MNGEEVKLGRLVTGKCGRDAVHVPVMPMTAVRVMRPGEHLANGIVDPFLTEPVRPGETFLLCLYPGTVTSLRHVWTHPAYPDEVQPAPKRRSEADVWAEQGMAAADTRLSEGAP